MGAGGGGGRERTMNCYSHKFKIVQCQKHYFGTHELLHGKGGMGEKLNTFHEYRIFLFLT